MMKMEEGDNFEHRHTPYSLGRGSFKKEDPINSWEESRSHRAEVEVPPRKGKQCDLFWFFEDEIHFITSNHISPSQAQTHLTLVLHMPSPHISLLSSMGPDEKKVRGLFGELLKGCEQIILGDPSSTPCAYSNGYDLIGCLLVIFCSMLYHFR